MEHSTRINQRKNRRIVRTRTRVFGTALRPRLAVFRSNTAMYAQLIDDEKGVTIAHARTKEGKVSKSVQAEKIGKMIAEAASKAGITTAVFDRRSYRYHGRVKALAEAARAHGLKF